MNNFIGYIMGCNASKEENYHSAATNLFSCHNGTMITKDDDIDDTDNDNGYEDKDENGLAATLTDPHDGGSLLFLGCDEEEEDETATQQHQPHSGRTEGGCDYIHCVDPERFDFAVDAQITKFEFVPILLQKSWSVVSSPARRSRSERPHYLHPPYTTTSSTRSKRGRGPPALAANLAVMLQEAQELEKYHHHGQHRGPPSSDDDEEPHHDALQQRTRNTTTTTTTTSTELLPPVGLPTFHYLETSIAEDRPAPCKTVVVADDDADVHDVRDDDDHPMKGTDDDDDEEEHVRNLRRRRLRQQYIGKSKSSTTTNSRMLMQSNKRDDSSSLSTTDTNDDDWNNDGAKNGTTDQHINEGVILLGYYDVDTNDDGHDCSGHYHTYSSSKQNYQCQPQPHKNNGIFNLH